MFALWKRVIRLLAIGSLCIGLVSAAAAIRIYRWYDIPSKEDIMNRNDTGLTLLDRNGIPFFTFNRSRPRVFTPLHAIPKHVQQAIIASEDKNFYAHFGFSPRAILRSLYLDVKYGQLAYGGSTITQQLVKNSLLTNHKSFTRKLQEIIIAAKVERNFSKDDILEMYSNSTYFGRGVFGIEEAAHAYFNTRAADLTLAQASILAALLPAPSSYSAGGGENTSLKERQFSVLQRMVEAGYVTSRQAQEALNERLVFQSTPDDLNIHAPHFALMVRDYLAFAYGEENIMRAGLKVRTTLDLTWQTYAEDELARQVDKLQSGGAGNGAVVVLDPASGEVLSLVGSVNWFDTTFGKINMALSPRQTGSAFKPIVYATALEKGVVTPATQLLDAPTTFAGNYKPADYDLRWRGPVLARRALANSLNVPAVQVLVRTGVPDVMATARRLGISSINEISRSNLSMALGTEQISLLELTNAYATFADSGLYHPPKFIIDMRDKFNRPIDPPVPTVRQAIDPKVAFLISSMLSDEKARAEVFGKLLSIGRPAAAKTGTTQDYRDAWTVGYTPQLAVGVWIGNTNNAPMTRLPGSIGAAPVWRSLLQRFSQDMPALNFPVPSGLVIANVCRYDGQLAGKTSGFPEYFIAGTQPKGYCAPPLPSPEISPITMPVPVVPSKDPQVARKSE